MSKYPHILILGAGPAGLGAAYRITSRDLGAATVVEKLKQVGGLTGSFDVSGVNVDYGSHRLHPSCDPEIMADLKALLGDELNERLRHGRIRLHNRWIHFPLKPMDMALKLPFSFSAGAALDLTRKGLRIRGKSTGGESFATVLEAGLGKAICHDFYFPYVQKIWGLAPGDISATQAHRRVSANSPLKMLKKVLVSVPGLKPPGSGVFYYPKGGFGRISEELYNAAKNAGADFSLGSEVTSVRLKGSKIEEISCFSSEGRTVVFKPDHVWATIPVTDLVNLIRPAPPSPVVEASQHMDYRAMILVYLVLDTSQFTEYDAHYFPESDIPITRISEPKNYSRAETPRNMTVLCAELPCSTSDSVWKMTSTELGELVCDYLKMASMPVNTLPREVITKRFSHAYPIYRRDYNIHFDQIDRWLSEIGNLVCFGRQALFAHDNTHHALYMAYAAVDCLGEDGDFHMDKWQNHYRRLFETHVVED
ncbi:MAG: FAD-dependent oxidoreductase [Sedimentisphaerales bacterium]